MIRVTRPLSITQLQQINADRANFGKVKQALHERIRRGVEELNNLLIQNWPNIGVTYYEIEDDFNYRGATFLEIVKRFEAIDPVTGWKLEIRWNPTKLATGIRALQVRINKNP